jgi:hypothetical protein
MPSEILKVLDDRRCSSSLITARQRARQRAVRTHHPDVQSKGWNTVSNGELLDAAEQAGFELLLTTDRRIRYQQNLRARRIASVVLTGSTWLA